MAARRPAPPPPPAGDLADDFGEFARGFHRYGELLLAGAAADADGARAELHRLLDHALDGLAATVARQRAALDQAVARHRRDGAN